MSPFDHVILREVELIQVDVGIAGPPGPPGPVGPLYATYTHVQTVAADTWPIPHMLGRIPKITVLDSAGDEVTGSVDYPDLNTVVLTFSAPFGGTAYLS